VLYLLSYLAMSSHRIGNISSQLLLPYIVLAVQTDRLYPLTHPPNLAPLALVASTGSHISPAMRAFGRPLCEMRGCMDVCIWMAFVSLVINSNVRFQRDKEAPSPNQGERSGKSSTRTRGM
jgi:hypothetical protein